MKVSKVQKPVSIYFPDTYLEPPEETQEYGSRATAIIFGTSIDATSYVGKLISSLGVHLSPHISNLFDALPSSNISEGINVYARKLDSEHELWGWTNPRADQRLESIQHHFRSPKYVLVWSDILADLFYKLSCVEVSSVELLDAQRREQDIINLLPRLNGPVLFVSHDKAINSPELLVSELEAFLTYGHKVKSGIE